MYRFLPQAGVGIEFREGNLYAFCAKRFWNRFRVLDRLEIPQVRQREPRECGKLYRQFLRRNGLKAPWTVVALPRSAVLLRPMRFPKGVEKDLARAVEYQLDSLHPFEEGSVFWDFAVWNSPQKEKRKAPVNGGSGAESNDIGVLVAIAQKQTVEELATWFQEAGIPVSQFGVTTTLLLAMFSSALSNPLQTGSTFFLLHATEERLELMGGAPGKTVVSREIPIAPGAPGSEEEQLAILERELELAWAEMRLEPDARPFLFLCGPGLVSDSAFQAAGLPFQVLPMEQVLSPLASRAEALPLRENIVGVAAALASVDRGLPLAVNLLPVERRFYQSPMAYVPTYALAGLVVIFAVALGVRGTVQDGLYSGYLARETQALLPGVQELETLQSRNQAAYERLAALTGLRNSVRMPLGMLEELTRLIPPDAWLQQLQYDGNAMTLMGSAQSASAVLQALSGSSYLESPQFLSALTRTPDGKEGFRIGVRLRVPNP